MPDLQEIPILIDLKVKVAILKQEIAFINKLFEKMDTLINKIDSQYDSLVDKTTKVESNLIYNKENILDLHKVLENSGKELGNRIIIVDKKLSNEIKTINSKIEKQESSMSSVIHTKLFFGGIVAAITWILSNLELINKIIS